MRSFCLGYTTYLVLLGATLIQKGLALSLAEPCGPSVVCINHYANVLPSFFHRNVSINGHETPFGATTIGGDAHLSLVEGADFLVWDRERGHQVLGSHPKYEYMFKVSEDVHEAPIYVPEQNKLYFSQLHPGNLWQYMVDLNVDPPTLKKYYSDPPVMTPNGGRYMNGMLLWGASGANRRMGGMSQEIGLRVVNLENNQSKTLINNYFGYYFNTIDDLAVHPQTGDIWFTDPQYSWFNGLTPNPPQLPSATYRYDVESGATFMVEDTLIQPNGITFSPDGKTLYVSESGAINGVQSPQYPAAGTTYNATSPRAIYAWDISDDGKRIGARRPLYLSAGYIPDGLKCAANGYIVAAVGSGVQVLDQRGQLLVSVQTNYTVQNFAWTGSDLKTLWLTGQGGVSRVQWNLPGPELTVRGQKGGFS